MSRKTEPRLVDRKKGNCRDCEGCGTTGMYQDRCNYCNGTGSTTPQPQQESEQMQDKQLKHTDKSFCYCIIDPDSEPEHDCDSNHCTSLDHVRKGCRCGFDRASNSHHKNDCAFCRTSKESLQVKGSESETFKTPELTPEQDARFDSAYIGDIYLSNDVDLLDETSVREDLKAHLATELELQRRGYEANKKEVKILVSSYQNALEYDYCNFGEYEGNSPQEIVNILIALLQKEQSVIK